MLYTVTEGMEDPTLASVPLHIAANGSLEVGQEVSVIHAGDAAELVTGSARKASAYPTRDLLSPVPVYIYSGFQ